MAAAWRHQAADGAQGGGFACAISPNEGDDFAIFYRETDAFEGMDVTVIGMNVVYFKLWHDFSRC